MKAWRESWFIQCTFCDFHVFMWESLELVDIEQRVPPRDAALEVDDWGNDPATHHVLVDIYRTLHGPGVLREEAAVVTPLLEVLERIKRGFITKELILVRQEHLPQKINVVPPPVVPPPVVPPSKKTWIKIKVVLADGTTLVRGRKWELTLPSRPRPERGTANPISRSNLEPGQASIWFPWKARTVQPLARPAQVVEARAWWEGEANRDSAARMIVTSPDLSAGQQVTFKVSRVGHGEIGQLPPPDGPGWPLRGAVAGLVQGRSRAAPRSTRDPRSERAVPHGLVYLHRVLERGTGGRRAHRLRRSVQRPARGPGRPVAHHQHRLLHEHRLGRQALPHRRRGLHQGARGPARADPSAARGIRGAIVFKTQAETHSTLARFQDVPGADKLKLIYRFQALTKVIGEPTFKLTMVESGSTRRPAVAPGRVLKPRKGTWVLEHSMGRKVEGVEVDISWAAEKDGASLGTLAHHQELDLDHDRPINASSPVQIPIARLGPGIYVLRGGSFDPVPKDEGYDLDNFKGAHTMVVSHVEDAHDLVTYISNGQTR